MTQSLNLALPALLLLATASIARASFSYCTHAPSRGRRPSRFLVGCNQILQSSTHTEDANNYDLWNADISPQLLHQQHEHEWASSILPLPEHADDPSIANRARNAMSSVLVPAGSSSSSTTRTQPPALDGRCTVNLDAFNNGQCKVHFAHVDPPVLIVDDFLTQQECDEIMQITTSPSPPAGVGRVIQLESRLSESNKSSYENTAVRRSTTWYVRYGAPQLAPILRGLLQLLPEIQLEQTEEVQLVRYMGDGQGFGWHEDALTEEEATPEAGGQRIATLLVYLDDCQDGSGRTLFRDLREGGGKSEQRLGVSPKKGRAAMFFPAITTPHDDDAAVRVTNSESSDAASAFGNVYFDNTRADHRTTHAGEPPQGNNGQKHIAQLWIHSGVHTPVVFGRGLNKHSEAVL